jgi:O-antigen ligase
MLQQFAQRLKAVWVPSRRVEYVYYFAISYSAVAAALNVEVPLVAAGLITFLAALCFIKMGSTRRDIYGPVALLLASQISHILVQGLAHEIFVWSDLLRWFILWMFATVIVQSLCLRPGFLLRCTTVIFAIGLVAVPSLGFNVDTVERARAGINIGGGLQNPNGLAAWFGFCAVVFGVAGIDAKRPNLRLLYWLAAILSLLVVALTVSRGALLGSALGLSIGFRRFLQRAFIPMLLLIMLAWLVFESGLINHIVSNYEERATEETGRFLLWPYVFDRIWESPFLGVGVSEIATDTPERGDAISTPHNSFLFFALSSGMVPFLCYLAFWIRVVRGSMFDATRSEYSPFRAALLIYVFVALFLGDVSAEPWTVLALAVAAGPPLLVRAERQLVGSRIRTRRLAPRPGFVSQTRTLQRKLRV